MSRGKKKKDLRSLSRKKPSTAERMALLEFALNGPAIVAAITGLATVEIELETIIIKRLSRYSEDRSRLLLEENAPLETFYQKILMGYALGLYDEDTKANLTIIKNIRNAFAHARIKLNFEHKEIKDALGDLKLPKDTRSKRYKTLKDLKEQNPPQFIYLLFCMDIASQLMKRRVKTLAAKVSRSVDKELKKTLTPLEYAIYKSKPRKR